MFKKILSYFTTTCLIIAMTPSVVFTAQQPDNLTGETVALLEAGDTMSINLGTITDNQGNIINNHGTVTTNASTGMITTNGGAVITDPYSGILSATSAGTVKVKATIDNAIENGGQYIKEFSITVVNHVQPVYDAYIALQNALEGNDLELLRDAAEGFSSILDIYNNLTDSQRETLGSLLNMSSDDAFSIIINDWVDTNLILSVADACDAFSTNPNKDTATEFTSLFESIIDEPAYEGTAELIRKFIPVIDGIYSDAKSFLDNSAPAPAPEVDNVPSTADSLNTETFMGLILMNLLALVACVILWRRKTQ